MSWLRDRIARLRAPVPGDSAHAGAAPASVQVGATPRWARVALAAGAAVLVYYLIGAAVTDRRDANLAYRPPAALLPAGGSVTAAMIAGLLEREAVDGRWTPNDPVIFPTALLRAMPAWQLGVHEALAKAAGGLAGAAGANALATVETELAVPPTRGWLHADWPFLGHSAGQAYGRAAAELAQWNAGPASDRGGFDRSLAGLRPLAMGVAGAIDTALDPLNAAVGGDNRQSHRAVFERARGTAYASAMVLRGVRQDFGPLLRAERQTATLDRAISALDAVASSKRWSVGRTDLVEQGYFLLQARAELERLAGERRLP